MFKGKNKIVLLLTIILGIIVLWLFYNNKSSSISWMLHDFSVDDTASIDKIILIKKQDTLLLERLKSGEWKLNKTYFAYTSPINKLLYTLNKIDIKTPVSKNETEKTIKELTSSGIRCEIYQHGALEKAYYLNASPSNTGTYMLLVDTKSGNPYEKPFHTYVPGYNGNIDEHYSLNIDYWKDKTIFSYDESQIKSITFENKLFPDKSFELSAITNTYSLKLLNNNNVINNLDDIAIRQYLTYYYKLSYEQSDSLPLQRKQHISTITVKGSDDSFNKVEVYLQKDSSLTTSSMGGLFLSVKLPNGQCVMVKPNIFGKLMQEPDYFTKK